MTEDEPDLYFVHPRSDLIDDRTRVLKHGDTFAVFDRRGDARPSRTSSHGLYHRGTRFLSRFELRIGEQHPLLLGSTVRDDNDLLTVDLANPELCKDGETLVPVDTVHIFRSRFVQDAVCHESIRVTNHGRKRLEVEISVGVDADYADVFEVRGTEREARGTLLPAELEQSRLTLRYRGLDGVLRTTRIDCEPPPAALSAGEINYRMELAPKQELELRLAIACVIGEVEVEVEGEGEFAAASDHEQAFARGREELEAARAQECQILTSNEQFNDWIARSVADLHLMVSQTEHGAYPYAGVPWFNTVFGRDGLITARETLWMNPSIARGVLTCLAATQASESSDERDAEPGKIVHEMREGEMAALGEVPFARYYGTVDATPLFVMLAQDYYVRSGDRELIERLWPAIEGALHWIDVYGDSDGDGFVEYQRHTAAGLLQQGWKDSGDSVFHRDGRLAKGPIALCEVQGYVYAAKQGGAKLAALLGHSQRAAQLTAQADALAQQFRQRFWSEALGMYVLALDGDKQPCEVRASNAGHCLVTGIAAPAHGDRLIANLMAQDMFSGWGVRTLGTRELRYNPMSYHNGSIWPHDNALIAVGLARYGGKRQAVRVLEAMFHASLYMDQHRMPELFCGFPRRHGQAPTLYPVACAPQAWAAAAVFMLLEACLGLEVESAGSRVTFNQPVMPASIAWLEIKNLCVGEATIDLLLRRARSDVAIEVLAKRGDASVTVTKTV